MGVAAFLAAGFLAAAFLAGAAFFAGALAIVFELCDRCGGLRWVTWQSVSVSPIHGAVLNGGRPCQP